MSVTQHEQRRCSCGMRLVALYKTVLHAFAFVYLNLL